MGLMIAGVECACVVCDTRLTIYFQIESLTAGEPPRVAVEGSTSYRCPGCKRKRPFKASVDG